MNEITKHDIRKRIESRDQTSWFDESNILIVKHGKRESKVKRWHLNKHMNSDRDAEIVKLNSLGYPQKYIEIKDVVAVETFYYI